MINKTLSFEIKQIGEESDRTLEFVGSDETPDRDNDIIEVAGWNLENYNKNPVFLWAHEHDKPPIGKAVSITKDIPAKKLRFKIQFPTAEEYPFADTIYKLYKGGYLNTTSVGFSGIKSKFRDEPEVMELPEWQRGRRYMEQELLELSAVPVPANPNALVSIRSKGFGGEDVKKIFVEEKAVIPYKKYPLADENTAWDGPAEIAAASVEDLKIMCTWYDAENADTKQAYKLPHHKADGYTTVWRGVSAAMGAVLGARGGVQIPESERKPTYNHLADHYKDFGKDPPEFKEYTADELKSMFPDDEKTLDITEVCESIKICNEQLEKIFEKLKEPTKNAELTEIKEALEDLKSQVLSLCEKDATKDIDLDAIEFVKSEEPPSEPVTPDELKQIIADIFKTHLKEANLI